MELDSFTEKLLEKTRVRQEWLNKKKEQISDSNNRKRHTSPLVDSNSLSNEVTVNVDDSPKRQCMDSEKHLLDSKTEDDKENTATTLCSDIDEDLPYVPLSRAPGLAGLRKARGNCYNGSDSRGDQQKPEYLDREVFNPIPSSESSVSTKSGCKARLAALAAHINLWEDDTSHTFPSERFPAKQTHPKSSKCVNFIGAFNRTNSINALSHVSDTSNKAASSHLNTNKTNTNSTNSSTNLQGECDRNYSENTSDDIVKDKSVNVQNNFTLSHDVPSSPVPKKAKGSSDTISQNQINQQAAKVNLWDKAIIATLEAQGYTKSPSAAKLSYAYQNRNKTRNAGLNKYEACEENRYESDEVMECNDGKSQSNVSEVMKISSHSEQDRVMEIDSVQKDKINKSSASETNINSPKKAEPTTVNIAKKNPQLASQTSDACTDPADLPLAARRALFERAFLEGNKSSDSNECTGSLVSTRAAFFEKASTNSVGAGKGGVKRAQLSSAPLKQQNTTASSVERLKKKVPDTSGKSDGSKQLPSSDAKAKNAVSMCSSTSNETTSHTLQVQQQLFQHNKDWKNNAIHTKIVEDRQEEMKSLLNYWNKKPASTNLERITEMISEVEEADTDAASEESGKHKFDNLAVTSEELECQNRESFEKLDGINLVTDNNSSIQDCAIENDGDEKIGDLTAEAVDVCNEMNEVLDEALKEDSFGTENIPPDGNTCEQKAKTNVASCVDKKLKKDSSEVYLPSYVYDNGEEMPLLHTVSFYRRQKQMQCTTPVRTIIRREIVCEPPSPEAEDRADVTRHHIKVLQDEMNNQQTIISQTSQALNLCHARKEFLGSTEQIEGERLLLIATQKRQACLNEIHHLKTEGALGATPDSAKGTLTLTDIRLPLKREFIIAQMEGKIGDAVHYFICLVRHRAHIIATQMLSTLHDIKDGAFHFTNHITFQELSSDFTISFEVYALQTKQEKISHDEKYHIKKKQEHSKIRLTPKPKKPESKLKSPAVSSPGNVNAVRTPSYATVGSLTLTLQNSNRKTYSLERVPFVSPLEGILTVTVQLHADHNVEEKGFLTMFEDVSGFGAWHRRWCVLHGKQLAYWKYPEDEKRKGPIGTIDLSQCITENVGLLSRDLCARPHTFRLDTVRPRREGDKETLVSYTYLTTTTTKYLLSADTKEERILWCNNLNKALIAIRRWNPQPLYPEDFSKMK